MYSVPVCYVITSVLESINLMVQSVGIELLAVNWKIFTVVFYAYFADTQNPLN